MLNLPGDDSYCKEFRQLKYYKDPSIFAYILDFTVLSFITNHRDQKPFIAENGTSCVPIIFDFGLG